MLNRGVLCLLIIALALLASPGLARLESRQQALIFGHAVPMPVVVLAEE